MEDLRNKSKRPIDYLPDYPEQSLTLAWKEFFVQDTLKKSQFWLYMAMSVGGEYESQKDLAQLAEFHSQLLHFVEASYFFNEEIQRRSNANFPALEYEPRFITRKEVTDPLTVIKLFCGEFPREYSRIELWDLLIAAISCKGPFEKQLEHWQLCDLYLLISTLLEASYLIIGKKEKHSS